MGKEFIAPSGVHQSRVYSHALRVGNTIYVSRQVAWDERRRVVPGGFEAQAGQARKNLKRGPPSKM